MLPLQRQQREEISANYLCIDFLVRIDEDNRVFDGDITLKKATNVDSSVRDSHLT